MLRPLIAVLALLLSLGTALPVMAQSSAGCQYVLGFATLHDLDPTDIGDCRDDQAVAASGNAQPHTTPALLAWRKADNWRAFTNGYQTWINGPNGLAQRLNTQRFSWEANLEGLPLVDQPAASIAARTTTHVGPARLDPDPALTPGEVFPDVTAAQVCVPGYASSVRRVSSAEKRQVYARYGVPDLSGQHEVDHFIALELGSDNALTNPWPEPYTPVPGAHEKDTVENYLHTQVCTGSLTLPQAQWAIASYWCAVSQQMTGAR
ncbi:MAG: hypothetical protein ACR2JY_14565 [Chloroflexota bacterium]